MGAWCATMLTMVELTSDGIFDASVAPTYDADHAERFSPDTLDPEVELLAELAGGGPVLEFAIGTGRVALPLTARGIDVSGIELSLAMVSELRAKPGGDEITVVVGDMTGARVPGEFAVVYLGFNTIMNLLSQDEQVACFENAARHLAPGGVFIVEVIVPQVQRVAPGERHAVFDASEHHIGIDEYEFAHQRSYSIHARPGRPITRTPFRYVWPAELDLMARIAGLEQRDRWGGFDRSPFTSDSERHVSVWSKPTA
jgi:SAM-dependent methyltransferase